MLVFSGLLEKQVDRSSIWIEADLEGYTGRNAGTARTQYAAIGGERVRSQSEITKLATWARSETC